MATWHQMQARKRGVRLYDSVLWNVITDPPNGCTSIMQFATEARADEFLANMQRNNPRAYVFSFKLRPANHPSRAIEFRAADETDDYQRRAKFGRGA